jgi:NosR/NirI family nitrous oxide reductase transcriptional regulator
MGNLLKRYTRWLHTGWPAGTVEKLPEVRPDGSTNVPGVYVSGDLTGVPLLKFSLDSGARTVRKIAEDLDGGSKEDDALDLVIVGAGVSGMAAAVEARERGLRFEVLEAAESFFTIVNFPARKPIYTYPRAMSPAGKLQVSAEVKEELLEELRGQVEEEGIRPVRARAQAVRRRGGRLEVELEEGGPRAARSVLVAIGRNGDSRRLDVPGEDLDKVYNRLHDPRDFEGKKALVVGGGDTALETAIALAKCGADVTLSYRRKEFSRPKPDNVEMVRELAEDPETEDARVEHPSSERVTTAVDSFVGRPSRAGRLVPLMESEVREIRGDEVVLETRGGEKTIENDVVFPMIGREAPLEFFRRSGVRIAGEMGPKAWTALTAFVLFCVWLYNWKSGGFFGKLWSRLGWFPTHLSEAVSDPTTLIGTIALSASGPAFWYTLAYSLVVVIFGVRRIRRRRTPYITAQTSVLMAIQVLPLFLLPEIILPQLHYHGLLPDGLANALFPAVDYGHGREFWRAYGLILAWPLNVYNVFTAHPLPAWLWICGVQTFVLIPLGIYFYGKGVYCGWICSCGALAETLGDTFRHKMPHGPGWNRLNMLGQGILALAFVLLAFRVLLWVFPGTPWLVRLNGVALSGDGAGGVFRLFNYKWTVDVLLAGVLGYGLYFWFSGRMWCRFACPLAALMHVYTRFSRYRILAEKKKCISCNVCTAVCHQGIDVMNFANKGLPMNDPECVRCSACVQSCPTGVLRFGQVDRKGNVISSERLAASPVRMREGADG